MSFPITAENESATTPRAGSGVRFGLDVKTWMIDFKDLELVKQIGEGSFGRVSDTAHDISKRHQVFNAHAYFVSSVYKQSYTAAEARSQGCTGAHATWGKFP